MSNCDYSANSQLKAMQARMDRIDDDLLAHYAGLSQLVKGLAANATTAGVAAPLLPVYNMSSTGQTLLVKLKAFLPGADQFSHLQHIGSAGFVSGMEDRLAAAGNDIANNAAQQATASVTQQITALSSVANLGSVQSEITAAMAPVQSAQVAGIANSILQAQSQLAQIQSSHVASLTAQKTAAQSALDDAVALGVSGNDLVPYQQAITDIDNQTTAITSSIAQLQSSLTQAQGSITGVESYFNTITDIGSCRTRSSIVIP